MKKIIKYIGIGIIIFVLGSLGSLLTDYIIFSKVITNPVWSLNPIIKALDNRVKVIQNTEKIIVEDNESIADIAGRIATSVVYVEVINGDGSKDQGNGVVIGSDGVIATTMGSIDELDQIYVKLSDNTVHTTKSIYTDQYTGITFFKIDAQNLATISFANSDEAQSGKRLVGIVQSRVDKNARFISGGLVGNIPDFSIESPVSDYLQGVLRVDFSENIFGLSIGAPAVDYHGNMVGLIARKDELNSVQEVMSDYYAIASNDVYLAFEDFLRSQNGEEIRPPVLLGVDYDVISQIDVMSDELTTDGGVRIAIPQTYQERVTFSNTRAAKSGLRGGDIIITVNDTVVDAKHNLSRQIHAIDGGQIVLKVLRGKDLVTVNVIE